MNSDEACPLGDLVELRRGSTYKSALLHQQGPVLLGLSSITPNGGFRRDSLKQYGGDSPEDITLRPGDVYVSLKDVTQSGDLLGAVARVPADVHAGRLTQDTVKLIFRDGFSEQAEYIYWLLRSPRYREYCRTHAIGVTTLALPRDDFLAFPVPPCTSTRVAIVRALHALDDKIDHNRAFARRLVVAARTAFESVDGERVRLSDVAELEKGVSYKGSGLQDSGLPMFNLANFTTAGWLDRSGLKYYSGDFRDRHVVTEGDLLLANTDLTQRRAILGQPILVPRGTEKALFTHHVFALRFRGPETRLRLLTFFALQSSEFRARAETFATGTTVAALPRDAVLDFEIQVPDAAELELLTGAADALVRRAWKAEDESILLASVRNALLPKLVSGDIRVPESYDPNDVLGTVVEQVAAS